MISCHFGVRPSVGVFKFFVHSHRPNSRARFIALPSAALHPHRARFAHYWLGLRPRCAWNKVFWEVKNKKKKVPDLKNALFQNSSRDGSVRGSLLLRKKCFIALSSRTCVKKGWRWQEVVLTKKSYFLGTFKWISTFNLLDHVYSKTSGIFIGITLDFHVNVFYLQ